MLFPYFSSNQIIPFIISAAILIVSIIFFQLGKRNTALILLFIGSAGLGFFIANLDHFLILWDESYHALVAKNMLSQPFQPTLYANPLLAYDYRNWTANHIWLHKQPLFLWQIALSLKIFGISALAVRVPSIVLHAIAVILIYRIGKITNDGTTGFYGALFFSVAYYPLELIAGRYTTDHNDVAFLFYVTAGFWAWFEYHHSGNRYWLLLIGIFGGFAVLVKWLMGLLIYPVWFISLLMINPKQILKAKIIFPLLISFTISLIVFIPWQLYIFNKFPMEAAYEFHLNTEHFFRAVENHDGNYWFHLVAIKKLYGSGFAIPFILIAGLFMLIKKCVNNVYRIAFLSAIIITYGFYTLAATKMISFCMIVSPFVFLGMGSLVASISSLIFEKIKLKKIAFLFNLSFVISICFLLLNLSKIQNYHTMWKPNDNCGRATQLAEMKFIEKLSEQMGHRKSVIFYPNGSLNCHIPVMFYTDYVAYNFLPTQNQVENLKSQSYQVAVVESADLPDYIGRDSSIVLIKP